MGTKLADCYFLQETILVRVESVTGSLHVKFHPLPGMRAQAHGCLFCPRCGEWFCCTACMTVGLDRHLGSCCDSGMTLPPAGATLGILRHGYSGRIPFKGIVSESDPLVGAGGKEILASQKCFQEVQAHRLGEVGVEAGFLGPVAILFLSNPDNATRRVSRRPRSWRRWRARSRPSIPGMLMSQITTSGGCSRARASAVWPSYAILTSWPASRSKIAMLSAASLLSSTTRIRRVGALTAGQAGPARRDIRGQLAQ